MRNLGDIRDELKDFLKEKKNEELEIAGVKESSNKKEYISPKGWALTKHGKLTKNDWFKFLDVEVTDYSDIVLSQEEAEKISKHLAHLSTGTTAVVPLYCGGEQCPFASTCPYVAVGKAPLLKQCLVEKQLINFYVHKYVDEFKVDPDNYSELMMVAELAELHIYEKRATELLAKQENAELVNEEVIGMNENGPIISKQIHQAWILKEKIKKWRVSLLEAMVGTRKEKYKEFSATRKVKDDDYSKTLGDLREKLKKYQGEIDNIAANNAEDVTNGV